jgi:2-methylisocitrate lyase-like PEP mutase family enzyme
MPAKKYLQSESGNLLHQLHHNGKLLVLPNIWDPLGALMLERMGYPAAATASASIALSNGYPDGEKIPFKDLLFILQKIITSVKIPVTADIESGYADNNSALKKNIKKLLDIGIAGINFEDSRHDDDQLISVEEQCEKISIIKKVAKENGASLFINARADVFIKMKHLSDEEKLSEAILRGKAYKEAGADGFYPIILKKERDIKILIKEVGLPVNILLLPGVPDFEILKKIGVSRVSLGPGFLKIAINAMNNVAKKLLDYEGMNEVAGNPVTTAYLNSLISKS